MRVMIPLRNNIANQSLKSLKGKIKEREERERKGMSATKTGRRKGGWKLGTLLMRNVHL